MEEEETMGENVFLKVGNKNSFIDYVVLDKKYVKDMTDQLSKVIVGGKRDTNQEIVKIDFDQFTKDES